MADFRSDTVTQPDDGMRAAMVSAEVGDAVFGDDPTVLRLEARVASMLGKEAALFVASGTMANTLAMRVHLAPLEEVVCDYRCHVHVWENGGVHAHTGAAVSAVRPRDHGERFITARILEEYVRLDHSLYHTPTTTLVALENTLNGAVQPLDEMVAVSDWARQRGVATHLDGARLWNAAAATGVELERYGALFDTVSVCLSKGLGAPIGSVLVGDAKRIEKARHFHKLMGGGWRQAGLLAAGGLYALEHNLPRLAETHESATQLAAGLVELGFALPAGAPETNMVWADPTGTGYDDDIARALCEEEGFQTQGGAYATGSSVATNPFGFDFPAVRFVTHLQTPPAQIARFLASLAKRLPR
jgi:threonine aldolase|tara:strand:- start:33 stop:1109 length:1077 start_codon:yes stop_codon:yes gene_type:complete